jgi:hypothetical protein
MEDYAGAVSADRGRCFRSVDDSHGRSQPCPRPVIASGRLQVGPSWVEVGACYHHSSQLRFLRRLELGPSSRYRSNRPSRWPPVPGLISRRRRRVGQHCDGAADADIAGLLGSFNVFAQALERGSSGSKSSGGG